MRLLYLLFILLFTNCGIQFQYTTLNTAGQIDGIYQSTDLQVDTISSVFDLKRKLRNDFNFRYDFATYAMNQPYSFYWNNPRLEGIWRPYNRFDVYFHSNWFWNDWAYNYPFHHTWGWNNWYSWNRPYYYYGWNRPYSPWNNWYQGPFNNQSYNVVYNASRRGRNVAYINGNRTSNNISNRLVLNRNKPRVNINKPLIIPNINNNSKPRINNNNNTIRIIPNNNNNYKPNNNNNYKPSNNYSRPSNNYSKPSNNYSRPSSNVISRPSSSSRGGKINRE